MNGFDAVLAHRSGERERTVRLICCDCGKPAEGSVSCDDGEICDACHGRDIESAVLAAWTSPEALGRDDRSKDRAYL